MRRVLILDDDEDVNSTISAIARRARFEPRSTTSPEEFLQTVATWLPSHVVVDLAMPGVDGVETLHRLALQGCEASIIIASGLGPRVLEAAARAAIENGLRVGGILPKPFPAARLREMLEAAPALDIDGGAAPRVAARQLEPSPDELAAALSARQFIVHYQPKVAVDTGEVVSFEGLARWSHPNRGFIAPDRFIPLAERTGQIHELTRQIFEQSLDWLAESFGHSQLGICLNLSPRILTDATFPEWMIELCSARGIDPSRVNLEVTETGSMQDPLATLEYLTQFRIKGFELSIDDFGVGYSSLVQLARLPFSEIKIDKAFVINCQQSAESRKIAMAIVGLAHALGLKVTAEGVEDEWTFDFLRSVGCDLAQGFWMSRPLAGDAARSWARAYRPFTPAGHDA